MRIIPTRAWLCLRRDVFERLYDYKVRTWDSHVGRSAGEHAAAEEAVRS